MPPTLPADASALSATARFAPGATALPWWVFIAALVLQLPLLSNPGYFSHDELQWAARTQSGLVFEWAAFDTYQYRPLTFNLWMWLSRHLFDTPQAFHAVGVAWGAANAALLAVIGRRLGMSPATALVGALVFAAGPFAAYVHGWVGTLADLVWLSCALLCFQVVLRWQRIGVVALAVGLLTLVGLLGKEAAISIPPMLAVAWLFDRPRRRAWFVAAAVSGVVVAAYLALRWDALLHAPSQGAQYALSAWNPPIRWIEYQLFPLIPNVFETFTVLDGGADARILVAAVLWCALVAALARVGMRTLALFLLGGIAALSAVLPLSSSWNHYGYAFAAVTAMVVAAAWIHAPRWGRGVIAVAAALVLLHGLGVMLVMRQVGMVQAAFSPALAHAVAADGTAPLHLSIAPGARDWVFRRLTHEIPSYAGVPIGDRVRLVDDAASAEVVANADGTLTTAAGHPPTP